jgi:uncharacterized protein YueI
MVYKKELQDYIELALDSESKPAKVADKREWLGQLRQRLLVGLATEIYVEQGLEKLMEDKQREQRVRSVIVNLHREYPELLRSNFKYIH